MAAGRARPGSLVGTTGTATARLLLRASALRLEFSPHIEVDASGHTTTQVHLSFVVSEASPQTSTELGARLHAPIGEGRAIVCTFPTVPLQTAETRFTLSCRLEGWAADAMFRHLIATRAPLVKVQFVGHA